MHEGACSWVFFLVNVSADFVAMAFTTECERHGPAHGRKPSQELVNELSDAFKFFDLNHDGKLSAKEMDTVVRSLGDAVTEADLEKLIKRADSDGDGQLDLFEFIDLNTQAISPGAFLDSEPSGCLDSESSGCLDAEPDALVAAFNHFDANNDGFISPEDLHKVLAAFGEENFSLEECRSLIKSADQNGDQMMSFGEFQDLMNDNPLLHPDGLKPVLD